MLSQTSIHAIRALIFLALQENDAPVGASKIAEKIQAPANYLGKTLNQLARAGLLISQRGLGGGLKLAKNAADISLFDIVEPIEHVSSKSHCFMNKLCCGPQPCRFHNRWHAVFTNFTDFLKSVSLHDLAEQNKSGQENLFAPQF